MRRAFSRQGDQIILNGKPAKPLNRSTINRQAIWRPGMSLDEIGALDPTKAHAVNPGASDSAARMADLDALGIDQQVVFPTLFGEYFPARRGHRRGDRLGSGVQRLGPRLRRGRRRSAAPCGRASAPGRSGVDHRARALRRAGVQVRPVAAHVHSQPRCHRRAVADPADGCGQPQRRVHRPRDVPARMGPHRGARPRRLRAPLPRHHQQRGRERGQLHRAGVGEARHRAHGR